MSILSFFRWTNSRHANDLTVDGFTRVTEHTGALSEPADGRSCSCIGGDTIPSAQDDRLGKLLRDA